MKNLRYLVVDDDPINNMICKHNILRFQGEASIMLFTIPEEGLEYIKEEYTNARLPMPTVLFLDINMPSMTGWEFLKVFDNFEPSLKSNFSIYILSSAIEDYREKARQYSCIDGFYTKPLKIRDLEAVRDNIMSSPI